MRGRTIAMIVQDAIAALNPVYRIGRQIAEPMLEHGVARTRAEARARAVAPDGAGRHPGAREPASTTTRTSSAGACASAW